MYIYIYYTNTTAAPLSKKGRFGLGISQKRWEDLEETPRWRKTAGFAGSSESGLPSSTREIQPF